MTKHQCKHCKDCKSDEEQCVHKLRVRKLKACDAYINDLHAKKICATSVTTDELNVPNFISLEKYGPNPSSPGCDCPSGIDTVPRIRLQQNVVANKNMIVNGQLCVKGDTTLCDVNVQNDLHVLGNETVDGTATFNGNAIFNNDLTVNGETTLNNLEVNGTANFTKEVILPLAPQLLNVDPTFVNPDGITQFHTVEEAVNSLKTKRIVPPVTIKLAQGVHNSIIISDFNKSVQSRTEIPSLGQRLDEGVKIVGDERPIVGQAYIDSVLNVSDSRVPDIVITTNIPGVGPYNAAPANFGGFPIPSVVKPGVLSQNAGVPPTSEQAIAPILNGAAINGNIGICRRGGIGFNQKAANLEAVGAVAMICINSVPGNSTIIMGGSGIPTTIPSVMVGFNDGNALLAAITSNPGLIITIASASPTLYTPAFGTFGGNVDLSHPLGDLTKLDVVITSAPISQPGRPTSAIGIENPNFADPQLGPVVAGDTVAVVLDSGVTVVRTIAGLEETVPGSGFFNRLVFTAALPSTASGPDASVTFRSNVLSRSVDPDIPALRVLSSSVLLQGISFTTGGFVGTTNTQAYSDSADLTLANISFDDVDLQYNTGFLSSVSTVVGGSSKGREGPITFIGHATSLSMSSITSISGGSWTVLTGRPTGQGVSLSNDTQLNPGSLLIATIGSPVGIRAYGLNTSIGSYFLNISGAFTGVNTLSQTDATIVGKTNITAIEYFSIARNGVGLSLSRDDVVSTPLIEAYGPATFSDNTTDFELRNSAKLIVLGPNVVFSGNQTYRVLDGSELNVYNTTTFAPNNVITYTASGPIDHALNQHYLSNAGVLNMTMEPNASSRLYLGREYTITDGLGGGFNHTLTLTGGAQLFGNGFNGATVATFSGVKGDFITLFVKDANTVLVRSKSGVA